MTFPKKLQSERLRLGLTQVQAAQLLGISASALGKWETGTKTPKALTQEGALARLADNPNAAVDRLKKQVASFKDALNELYHRTDCTTSQMEIIHAVSPQK